MEHGVSGEIRRLTLFGKLDRSPDSGPSRNLVTNSSKYGLTSGSYSATSLSVTDKGRIALAVEQSPREAIETQFQLAIGQFEPFNNLYEKLKDQRIPTDEVLKDELGNVGSNDSDRSKAAEIFTANLRFLGLIHNISGSDYVRTIEQVLEEKSEKSTSAAEDSPKPNSTDLPDTPVKPSEDNRKDTSRPNLPELHVDIQIEKSEQRGYMEIFAGTMTGIRNPRAHDHELDDQPEAALEMLALANHLIRKLNDSILSKPSK